MRATGTRFGLATTLFVVAVLGGCAGPAPLAPGASPADLELACDGGDLDACATAARQRRDQYEAAMKIN